MDTQPSPESITENTEGVKVDNSKIMLACIAAALVPGVGHAIFRKWERAALFFCCIAIMVTVGISLDGEIVDPSMESFFATIKFVAEAGAGLFYWIPWFSGLGIGQPTSQTYDYANIFLYVAGLLNMLIVVDAFDIAMGRKQ
jgi:hypothetical protein